MDFMNSIGVFVADGAVWSILVVLISISLAFALASSSDRNQFWSMHSARTLPLKLSTNALSVGFPGREKSSVMPLLQAHKSRSFDINSGPLSTRACRASCIETMRVLRNRAW